MRPRKHDRVPLPWLVSAGLALLYFSYPVWHHYPRQILTSGGRSLAAAWDETRDELFPVTKEPIPLESSGAGRAAERQAGFWPRQGSEAGSATIFSVVHYVPAGGIVPEAEGVVDRVIW